MKFGANFSKYASNSYSLIPIYHGKISRHQSSVSTLCVNLWSTHIPRSGNTRTQSATIRKPQSTRRFSLAPSRLSAWRPVLKVLLIICIEPFVCNLDQSRHDVVPAVEIPIVKLCQKEGAYNYGRHFWFEPVTTAILVTTGPPLSPCCQKVASTNPTQSTLCTATVAASPTSYHVLIRVIDHPVASCPPESVYPKLELLTLPLLPRKPIPFCLNVVCRFCTFVVLKPVYCSKIICLVSPLDPETYRDKTDRIPRGILSD